MGKSYALRATTKTGVSDARLFAAFSAATLRWLEGLLICYCLFIYHSLQDLRRASLRRDDLTVASDTPDTKRLRRHERTRKIDEPETSN